MLYKFYGRGGGYAVLYIQYVYVDDLELAEKNDMSWSLIGRAELLLGQDLGMDILSDDDDDEDDGEDDNVDAAVVMPPPPGRASRPLSAYRRE